MSVKTFSEWFEEYKRTLRPEERACAEMLRPSMEQTWRACQMQAISSQNNAAQAWVIERRSYDKEIAELREDLKWAVERTKEAAFSQDKPLISTKCDLIIDRHKLNNGSKPV